MSVAADIPNRMRRVSQQLPRIISNNFSKAHFVVKNSKLKPLNGVFINL